MSTRFVQFEQAMDRWWRWLDSRLSISHGAKDVIQSMEGIRGLGCVLVFAAHYSIQFSKLGISDPMLTHLAQHARHVGELALDLFFLMSGYLIYRILLERQPPFLTYLRRRLLRIYPTFLFVFGIYLALFALIPGRNELPTEFGALLSYLALNVLLLPGMVDVKPMIAVAWTLSYELCFYLLAPLVVHTCSLRRMTALKRLVFLMAFSVAGFGAFNLLGGRIRMMTFVAGMIVFELHRHTGFRVPRYAGAIALVVACSAQVMGQSMGLGPGLPGVVAYACYLVFGIDCFAQTGTDALFRVKGFRLLGNLSYSFYLTHTLIIHSCLTAVSLAFPQSFTRVLFCLLWVPVLALAIVCGGATFCLVEKPLSLSTRRRSVMQDGRLEIPASSR